MGKPDKNRSQRKDSERKMNLHKKRFVEFMQYLKDKDGKITIKHKDEKSGETFTDIYSFSSKDIPIVSLIAEACDISGSLASDYISRDRPVETKHSHLQRTGDIGRVIYGIEYYFASDSGIGKESIFSRDRNPYSLRIMDPTMEEIKKDFEKDDNQSEPNFLTQKLPGIFAEEFHLNYQNSDYIFYSHLMYNDFPFNDLIKKFGKIYENFLLDQDHPDTESFKETSKKLFLSYERQLSSLPKGLFMPGYIDFYIPYTRYNVFLINMFERQAKDVLTSKLEDIPFVDLIRVRYEIIKYFKSTKKKIEDWPIVIQALVLLVHYEAITFKKAIFSLTLKLLDDIRFIVYSSDSNISLDRQHDSLDIQDLSRILRDYQFKKGLNNTFNMAGHQLIDENLYKYPEPHAVSNLTSESTIEYCISATIRKDIERKFLKSLYFYVD